MEEYCGSTSWEIMSAGDDMFKGAVDEGITMTMVQIRQGELNVGNAFRIDGNVLGQTVILV